MDNSKPASIKTTGFIVGLLAAMMILSNTSGALMHKSMGISESGASHEGHMVDRIMTDHYVTMCITMVIVGLIYLVGALYLRKYKLWANRLVSFITVLLILGIWWMMIGFVSAIRLTENIQGLWLLPIVAAIGFSIPLAFLVRFLNREQIKKHFT